MQFRGVENRRKQLEIRVCSSDEQQMNDLLLYCSKAGDSSLRRLPIEAFNRNVDYEKLFSFSSFAC